VHELDRISNAIHKLGYRVRDVSSAADLQSAHRVVFPGVGCFGAAVERLHQMGVWDELIAYVRAGRPFLGICVGMQVLFEEGEESPGVKVLFIGSEPRQSSRC
jgi:glutamine amidotransferase/cyclase